MEPATAAIALRDPVPEPAAFARTYRGDRDGWERVLEHRRVERYCAKNPEQGSSAVANALDLPRSRIRAWVDDGGAPDPVRGLRTALDRGWLVPDLELQRRSALAVCVAWIFAGGSISADTFQPRFTAQTEAERERITDAAETLDVELAWIDRDDEGQGVEGRPSQDASVFGRVLVAAGAPTGPSEVLPQWIRDEPASVKRDVAAAYVECRGQLGGEGEVLQIGEASRSPAHLEALGDLLVGVAGRGSYSAGGTFLHLDQEATDALLETLEVEV